MVNKPNSVLERFRRIGFDATTVSNLLAVRRAAIVAVLFALFALSPGGSARAQGTDFEGHPNVGGAGIFAAWNSSAGRGSFGDSPRGWDYRINLPYTSLSATNPRARSGAAMVGVVEDATYATLQVAQHVNNSIWLFAVDASGGMRFKVLPSRRSLTSNAVENVTSLATGWYPVGPRGTTFVVEKPTAVVLGEGLGVAKIYLVARTPDHRLLLTSRLIDSTQITDWSSPWVEVAPSAGIRPSVSTAFGDRIAIAWIVGFPSRVDVRLYAPSTNTFGPVSTVASSGGGPLLIWDGSVLNLFYIGPILEQAFWHTFARSATNFAFATPTRIGNTVLNSQCDAISFNRRLHVACARIDAGRSRIWYSTSIGRIGPPFGPLPWEPVSHVGLDYHDEPQLGAVGDELYVLGVNCDGILQYSRRDPHVRAYEWAGGTQPVERWLEIGSDVDPSQRARGIPLEAPELLSFNRDLYLTGARNLSSPTDGLYVVNFGRAAFSGLLRRRLGIRLGWGEDGDLELIKPNTDPVAAAGAHFFFEDFTNDGRADLVRAAVQSGGGELRVARALPVGSALQTSSVWLAQFAFPGNYVRVGDVNGDGFKDFVRFFRGSDSWGAHIAYSNGAGITFQLTVQDHRLTTGTNDVPLLGDVNDDGRADLVLVHSGPTLSPVVVKLGLIGTGGFGSPHTWSSGMAMFADAPILMDLDGNGSKDLVTIALGGGAPFVRAALSTGTSFGPPSQWAGAVANLCRSYDVGDMNQDGRDDLLCFVREWPNATGDARSAYVLFAEADHFSLPNVLVTNFTGANDLPLVGNFSPDTKGNYTNVPADHERPIFDLLTIRLGDGRVGWRQALGQFPVPSGLPWERYRFFTEKGIGAAMFPDWLWSGSPCVRRGHLFLLLGAAGTGSPSVTRLSVRPGSAESHVLEELGHSVFFNCFRESNDPFGLTDDIFTMPLSAGGFEANFFAADTCAGGAATWVDCRDPEHFFLAFMRVYRTSGDAIRATIAAETDPARKARYQARYNWLKNRWFSGAEFYRDPTVVEARRDTVGLQCLRGHASFSFDNCSAGPPTLTVKKILVHPDPNHLRLFNLQIDGVTVRANVNAGAVLTHRS